MYRSHIGAIAVTTLVSGALAVADFPPPYHTQRSEVDQLVEEFGRSRDQLVLQRIAGGFIEDSERPISVREYAIGRLAEAGIKETEPFLLDLAASSEVPVLRGAARLGVWTVRFVSAGGIGRRREVAATVLRAEGAVPAGRDVEYWAAQRLCELGAVEDLAEIQRAFRHSYGEKRAEEDLQLCKLQMNIPSDEKRVEALAAGLAAPDPLSFGRYHLWLIRELESLGEEGKTVLIAHATRLSKDEALDASGELPATIRALRRMEMEPDELIAAGLPALLVHRFGD